jgi:hypothetical protein
VVAEAVRTLECGSLLPHSKNTQVFMSRVHAEVDPPFASA